MLWNIVGVKILTSRWGHSHNTRGRLPVKTSASDAINIRSNKNDNTFQFVFLMKTLQELRKLPFKSNCQWCFPCKLYVKSCQGSLILLVIDPKWLRLVIKELLSIKMQKKVSLRLHSCTCAVPPLLQSFALKTQLSRYSSVSRSSDPELFSVSRSITMHYSASRWNLIYEIFE